MKKDNYGVLRSGLTTKEVLINLLEVANFLGEQEGNANDLEIEVHGIHMHFEVWTDEEDDDE